MRLPALVAVVALAGCNPAPAPQVTPAASPSPSPAGPAAPSPSPSPLALVPPGQVPAGFRPFSTTWVSTSRGWALGTAPCAAAAACTALLQTDDGGRSWRAVTPPPAPIGDGGDAAGVAEVRFADSEDGWAFRPALWATHDGGASWHRLSVLDLVFSLEATAGNVFAAGAINGDFNLKLLGSTVGRDAWSPAPIAISMGAGPVPTPELVATHGRAWLLHNNRALVGAARLGSSGWASWSPPCSPSGGSAVAAAASATWVAVVCAVGTYGAQNPIEVFVSGDGGSTFRRTNAGLPFTDWSFASPVPGTLVASGDGIRISTDSGATWTEVYSDPDHLFGGYVGFTSATQGVALFGGDQARRLLMSFDGGRHWQTVSFGG